MHITGPAASAADEIKIFKGIDTTLLFATLAVVIGLLLLTYRSPVLWLLPIVSAGVALTVAEAVIYLLTRHGLTVNGQSAGILVVLVLGAGTDYALLLIARYREELRRHEDRHEAMAVALRRAGPAIIASARDRDRGHALPAGRRLRGHLRSRPRGRDRHRRRPDRHDHAAARAAGDLSGGGSSGRSGRGTARPSRRPAACGPGRATPSPAGRALVWTVTAVLLGCASLGLIGFKVGSLTTAQSFRGTPASVAGEQVLARHFPAGAGEPVAVIGNAGAEAPLRSALASDPGHRRGVRRRSPRTAWSTCRAR